MHPQKHAQPHTFQKEGKWIENPAPSKVLTCPCGMKYLKTRAGQTTCLRCMRDALARAKKGR